MQKTSTESLASKSLNALKWNYIGRFISLSLQFSIGVVLARLLGPEPFGLVAIALFVQGLGNLFAEGGLGSALIQSQDIDEHDIRSVFTTQLLIGIITSAVIIGLAPLLASFFHEPNAAPVIMAMALSFTLQAFGQTANSLLRREFEFKKIQIISIVSYCIGYIGLGLPMAFMDYGVWSLVAAQLSQTTVNAITSYLYHRHKIFPLTNPKHCRFLRFGAAMTLNNMTSWGISGIDTAFIGHFFETTVLGFYNRAFNLLNMPMYAVTSSMQSVILSTAAKAQDDQSKLQNIYIASVSLMALLFLPVYSAISAVPELLLLGIYGDKWQLAVPLIMPLALAMAINAMLAMTGPLLTGIGKPQIELKVQLMTLVLSIPSLYIAAQTSILNLAWVVFASYVIRFLLFVLMTFKELKIKKIQLLDILVTPIIISIISFEFSYFIKQQLIPFEYSATVNLIIVILSCSIFYPLLLLSLRRVIVKGSIKNILISAQAKLPPQLISLSGIKV